MFEREVAGGFADSPLQIVDRFELRHLGTDQTEHHGLAPWHKAQRRETADGRVFGRAKFILADLATLVTMPRVRQRFGPQQAADDVGADALEALTSK